MSALILDGTKTAHEIKAEVRAEVRSLTEAGARPGLAVILVGANPASEIYVRNKVKACEELGIQSVHLTPDEKITTEKLIALVNELNARDDVDGILVQSPLPPHIDTKAIFMAVSPDK